MEAERRFRAWRSFADKIAGWYCRRLPSHVLREDLIAAAHLGLWQAIRRSPEDRTHYFGLCIRGAIGDELRRQDWSSRRARAQGQAMSMIFGDELLESFSEAPIALETMERSERSAALELAISSLSEREQFVVRQYLDGGTMKAIGERLDVSEPRISQIMSVIKLKLAHSMIPESAPVVAVSEPPPPQAIFPEDGRNDALARSLRFARQIHSREDWL